MMSMFLEEVATRHPGDLILMLMDQASWHKAQELRIPQNMGALEGHILNVKSLELCDYLTFKM